MRLWSAAPMITIPASSSSVAQWDRSASFPTVSYVLLSHETLVRQLRAGDQTPLTRPKIFQTGVLADSAVARSRPAPTLDAAQELSHSGRDETVAGQTLSAPRPVINQRQQ